jgi:hypothetical protein
VWDLGRSYYWLEAEPLSAWLQSWDQGRRYHWVEAKPLSAQQFARMKEVIVGWRLDHEMGILEEPFQGA